MAIGTRVSRMRWRPNDEGMCDELSDRIEHGAMALQRQERHNRRGSANKRWVNWPGAAEPPAAASTDPNRRSASRCATRLMRHSSLRSIACPDSSADELQSDRSPSCACSREEVLLFRSRVRTVTRGLSGRRDGVALPQFGSPLTTNPFSEPVQGTADEPCALC